MAENNLPDILDTIPEPSLITSNGFKYYDENDITSWLSGFNVFVLAVDETITELKERILILEGGVIVIQHPSNIECGVGIECSIQIVIKGSVVQYQWEISKDDGLTWSDSTANGATVDTLYFTTTSAYNGIQYRCKITAKNGDVVYTNVGTITITE